MNVKGSITVTGGDAATQTYASASAATAQTNAITTAASNTAIAVNALSGSLGAMAAINAINSGNATTFIGAGVIVANMFAGTAIQSTNYVAGTNPYFSQTGTFIDLAGSSIRTQGFGVDSSGNSYFNGNVTATAGTIGGWLIGPNSISRTIGSRSTTLDASTGFLTFGGDSKIVFDTGGSGIIDFLGSGGIQMLSTSLGILAIRGGSGYGAGNRASMAYGTTEALYAEHSTTSGWAGYFVGQVACTGNITAYYSDERLKTKISNIPNALDKIQKLNGFYYTNNDLAKTFGYTEDKIQIGVSAQEVKEVFPEIVLLAPFDSRTGVSKSGENYLTVDYTKLVPVLIEAIKELSNKVENLEKKLKNR
jgi:hypothetical protein